jgi:hypothetical protein
MDERYRVKVGDFGNKIIAFLTMKGMSVYSQQDYKLNSMDKVPVRWTAPEIFHGACFSLKSDIWSFAGNLFQINVLK